MEWSLWHSGVIYDRSRDPTIDNVTSNVTMTGEFSSDAVAVIDRKLDANVETRNSTEDISSYYELSRCSEWIKQGRFSKVAA